MSAANSKPLPGCGNAPHHPDAASDREPTPEHRMKSAFRRNLEQPVCQLRLKTYLIYLTESLT
jgi:hypothetical protein